MRQVCRSHAGPACPFPQFAMAPRLRLRVKTKAPNIRRTGRPKGSTTKQESLSQQAIRSGLVPKARKPFCLFVVEHAKTAECADLPWKARAKKLGERWNNLDKTTQDEYRQRSADEFRAQKQALQAAGINISQETLMNSKRPRGN